MIDVKKMFALAESAYLNKKYLEALEIYKDISKNYGLDLVKANIVLCENRLNEAIDNELTFTSNYNSISSDSIRQRKIEAIYKRQVNNVLKLMRLEKR